MQKRWLWLGMPVVAGGLLFLLQGPIRRLGTIFPPCVLHQTTGLFCPGCGNTRAVLALLQGRILSSLQYNVTPLLLIVLVGLLYLERLLAAWGHPKRLLPRRPAVWFTLIGIMLLYFTARNFLPFLAPPA